MAKVIVGVRMSIDGFANDRNGEIGSLYNDFAQMRETEQLKQAIRDTGAVVMGRNSYDMAQGDLTDYEFQVPLFVVTHKPPSEPPKGLNERMTLTFVTDGVEHAIARAKAAAGDRDVTVVGGASTFQQIVAAGLADELHIDIRQILLGDGLRFFGDTGEPLTELELFDRSESPGVVHLRYRFR